VLLVVDNAVDEIKLRDDFVSLPIHTRPQGGSMDNGPAVNRLAGCGRRRRDYGQDNEHQ
jgi:hypothetical protein